MSLHEWSVQAIDETVEENLGVCLVQDSRGRGKLIPESRTSFKKESDPIILC